ncbi:MAG: glycosyltransferase family 4 protein [Microbacterium sp.]
MIFDRAASRINFGDSDVLISMPGSSLRTFEKNSHRRLIFHEIDAHPRTRNELLEQHYGRQRARAEMFPAWFVQRIEAEIALSSQVLVPGQVVADQMLAHGVPESKLVRIPYGVDPTVFKPDPRPRERGSPRLQVVCTAQISLRKGIPFLIEAVRGKNVDLTLVGQVFDHRIVESLPSNVFLAGILSAPQLADLYARSDLFVLPSIEDCFSLVVAEAAGAGLPVVTTKENGAHEVLSERHTVIDAGSTRELEDAINSARALTHSERLSISEEALHQGWSDWTTYAESVLRMTGVVE